MFYIRLIGLVLIGIAAVVVTFALAPPDATVPQAASTGWQSQSAAIEAAISNGKLNESSAESAPQQQVVNGWTARDLLEINDNQLDQLGGAVVSLEEAVTANAIAIVQAENEARDDRMAYLVMLAVLALVVIGVTQPRQGRTLQATPAGDEIAPPPLPRDNAQVGPGPITV